MKRMLLALSHPHVVLLLGTAFAVGTAVQLVWRGEQGAAWAYPVAGMFLFACLGAVTGWIMYRRGEW